MRDKRFTWIWVALGGVAVLLVVLQVVLFLQIREEVTVLRSDLALANAQLASEIQDVNATLISSVDVLDERIKSTASTLYDEIEERDTSAREEISGLQGKLGVLEEEARSGLDELREQVDLNLKSQDFSLIVEESLQSVVSIYTDVGSGSGVIVSSKGYVVTNYHVVRGASEAGVRTHKGKVYGTRLVAYDRFADLALLKIEGSFKPLSFEKSSDVKVGTKVIAMGSPAGLEFTVTEGIVSATDRVNEFGIAVVQTDVPINPGNSGGPLLNNKGNIVGINTYKASGYESLGFAVQADVVQEFVTEGMALD